MQRGYIKLWRKTLDSGLLQMPETFAVFLYILMKATHKPLKIGTPNGMVDLDRGQYISGRIALAKTLGLTERKIRTALDRLEEYEILTIKTTNKYSIYTVVNYSNYQDSQDDNDQQFDQQTTNKRPTNDQQTTTKQELKHLSIKELNKYIPPIPDDLLQEWKVIRKKKKSGDVTKRVFNGIEREAKLAGISSEKAIEVCCEKGWASFDASWYSKIPAKQDSLKRTGDLLTGRIRDNDTFTIDVD